MKHQRLSAFGYASWLLIAGRAATHGSVLAGDGAGALSAELPAIAQSQPTLAAAVVDFAALLHKAQRKAFCPASVVVRDGETAVPARVEPADGLYRVLWQVPAADAAHVGQVHTFRMEFGDQVPPHVGPRLDARTVDNLLDNGRFERVTGGIPDGVAPSAFRRFLQLGSADGLSFLAFRTVPNERGPSYSSPHVAVTPGQSYRYAFRWRTQGAAPQAAHNLILAAGIYYADAAGKGLPRVQAFASLARDSGGWQAFDITLAPPAEARFAWMTIGNFSSVSGSVRFTDLRIVPAAAPQVTTATTPDGRTLSLRTPGADIRRFDLGPERATAWPGFVPLTPGMRYAAERGYGFTRLDGPYAAEHPRPDALGRSFLSARRADLRVDLPDGEYRVWALIGDSQCGSVVQAIYRDSCLQVNGQPVLSRNDPPAEFFRTTFYRHRQDFWVPGMDYYDTFVAQNFETHTFPATVRGGKLPVSWRNLPLAGLVIYPQAQEAAMADELSRLQADRRRATAIVEVPGPQEAAAPAGDPEQRRGWVLFRRPANERIYPTSRPRADERIERLRVFSPPGEYVPTHFSLLPLRDLGQVGVRATDLRCGGRTIPAAAVDVQIVRYIFQQTGDRHLVAAEYRYQIAPFLLDHRPSVPAPRGLAWSWWATVRVPDDTAPGVYEGALEIACEHGVGGRLPLSVEVLPLRLVPLPIAQGYYYYPSEPWYSTFIRANVHGPTYQDDPQIRTLLAENERRELRFMKSLGLNSAAFTDGRDTLQRAGDGVRFLRNSPFAWWMDLYASEGMGPMPFYGFTGFGETNALRRIDARYTEPFTPQWTAAYRGLIADGQQLARERRWPEILWYLSDELSNRTEEGGKLGVQLAAAAKGVPGARTLASLNGPFEHAMSTQLNVAMPNLAFPITDDTLRMLRDAGTELWLYNCSEQRLTLGLYPWRVQAKGRFQWHYRHLAADPWDDLDGTYGDSAYCISFPAPDGPVPALRAAILREAINDHRYAATLEQALAAAAADPRKQAAVQRGRQLLDDLRRRIPIDIRTLVGFRVDPQAATTTLGGEFTNTDALDRVREQIAREILAVNAADGKRRP